MKKYRLVRTSIRERIDGFKRRARNLRAAIGRMKSGRAEDMQWIEGLKKSALKRSRETAADIISAHLTGVPFIDVGNVPNIGQVSNLPMGAVLETAVRVDRNGFTPLAFGPLPEPVLGLVAPYPAVFTLAVEASYRGDMEMALQALRLDPVCARLNGAQVREMGLRLARANADWLPAFNKRQSPCRGMATRARKASGKDAG